MPTRACAGESFTPPTPPRCSAPALCKGGHRAGRFDAVPCSIEGLEESYGARADFVWVVRERRTDSSPSSPLEAGWAIRSRRDSARPARSGAPRTAPRSGSNGSPSIPPAVRATESFRTTVPRVAERGLRKSHGRAAVPGPGVAPLLSTRAEQSRLSGEISRWQLRGPFTLRHATRPGHGVVVRGVPLRRLPDGRRASRVRGARGPRTGRAPPTRGARAANHPRDPPSFGLRRAAAGKPWNFFLAAGFPLV